MRKFLLAITLSSLALSTAASAQGSMGTPQEQAACSRDAQRFCRNVISQGDLAVLACFQQNRAQISRACDAVLRSHGQ